MATKKLTSEWEVWNGNEFVDFDGIQKLKKDKFIEIFFKDNIKSIKCSLNEKLQRSDGKLIYAKDVIQGENYNGHIVKETIIYNQSIELYDLLNSGENHLYMINDSIIGSNCAFVPHMDEFWSSVFPTISSGNTSKVILVSTPNGAAGFFYDTWQRAIVDKSSFIPSRVDWWQVPGRDENWKKLQLGAMDEMQFAQEYGNDFLGSSNTLLNAEGFKILEEYIQEPIGLTKDTRIFEEPIEGHQYFISCDCASVGDDYSAFHVFDITSFPYREVLSYANNRITHLQYPQLIAQIGYKYNNAAVLVENNEIGMTVLQILNYELEYPEVISTKISTSRYDLGVRTTAKSKALGCARLAEMITKRKLIFRDKRFLDEQRYFVVNNTSYAADKDITGAHDDITMAAVIFAYYVNTPSFNIRYEQSFGNEMRKQYEIDAYEALAPLPVFGADMHLQQELEDWQELLAY